MKTIWPAPQQRHFAGLRLLDLDDHVGPAVDLFGRGDQFGPMADVVLVGQAGADARARLDQHAVSGAGQFFRPHGQQADAIFVTLDFFGDADDHDLVNSYCSSSRTWNPMRWRGSSGRSCIALST